MTWVSILVSTLFALFGWAMGCAIVSLWAIAAREHNFVIVLGMIAGLIASWPINRLLGTLQCMPACPNDGNKSLRKYLLGPAVIQRVNGHEVRGVMLKCQKCGHLIFFDAVDRTAYFISEREGVTWAIEKLVLSHHLLPGKWSKDSTFSPVIIEMNSTSQP